MNEEPASYFHFYSDPEKQFLDTLYSDQGISTPEEKLAFWINWAGEDESQESLAKRISKYEVAELFAAFPENYELTH